MINDPKFLTELIDEATNSIHQALKNDDQQRILKDIKLLRILVGFGPGHKELPTKRYDYMSMALLLEDFPATWEKTEGVRTNL